MLWNHIPIDPLALFGKPLNKRGGIGDFATRLSQRFTLLSGHNQCQIFLVFQHQVVPGAQSRRALFRRQCAPARQCCLRRFQCMASLCCATVGNCTYDLVVCRIGHLFGAAVVSIHPSAVDITTLAKQPIVFKILHGFVPDLNFDQTMAARTAQRRNRPGAGLRRI